MPHLFVLAMCLASTVYAGCCGEGSSPSPPGGPVSQQCLDCLCSLQTQCNVNRGCANGDCGPFAITMPYWEDTVGIVDPDGSKRKDPKLIAEYEKCTTDLLCSKKTVQKYMQLYSRDCNNDGVIDCLDFAAIHNLGPTGCLQTPFPQEKKTFIKNCLKEKGGD